MCLMSHPILVHRPFLTGLSLGTDKKRGLTIFVITSIETNSIGFFLLLFSFYRGLCFAYIINQHLYLHYPFGYLFYAEAKGLEVVLS